MYRAIPKGNKLLDDRWNRRKMQLHLEKLRTIKPVVETYNRTVKSVHLARNSKKEQIFEGSRGGDNGPQIDARRSSGRTGSCWRR